MSCVNSDDVPYLKTYGNNPTICKIQRPLAVNEKENLKKGYDFFYILFSDKSSFELFSLNEIIPEKFLKLIYDKKLFLVLDNSLEYFLDTVDSIYQNVIVRDNIPAEQIILITSVPTMHYYVEEVSKKYSKPAIKVEWFAIFEEVGKQAIEQRNKAPTLEKKKKYKKSFLCLNRRWRLHRPFLITLLHDRKLLERGFVSLGESDDNIGWSSKYSDLMQFFSNNDKISDILKNNRDIIEMNPLYLDTNDLKTNRATHESSINDYYRETYFSVITETTYFENIPFLSEKVFKAVAMSHPFILVTSPNTLQHLKNLGYRTFHPFINEEYDSIIDPGDRMLKIVDEIERLCNMSKHDFKQWRVNVKSIVDYNFNVLNKKQIQFHKMNF